MSIADKLTRAKQDIDDVYEAGKKSEYDRFWDAYQQNGKRTSYAYAFAGYGWSLENFKPKYDMKPTVGAKYMFATMPNMEGIDLEQLFEDLGVSLDTSAITSVDGFDYFIQYASPSVIPTISTVSTTKIRNMFFHASKLVTIRKLILRDDGSQEFTTPFPNCKNLENLVIEGTIGQKGFDISGSPKLSKASITSIINALSSTTRGLSISLSKEAVNTAFGINVDDTTTYPSGSEYYTLRHSKDNWTINYI